MFCTHSKVKLIDPTILHTLLDGKVEYCFLLTVVDTSDTCKVALTLIRLDAVDDVSVEVLHCHLRVVEEEFLTVNENLVDALAVNLHVTVIVNFRSWKTLNEFFKSRTSRYSVGRSVIDQRVARNLHLCSICSNLCLLEHHSVSLQGDVSHIDILLLLLGQVKWQNSCLITNVRNFESIFPFLYTFYFKCTQSRCSCTIHKRTVGQRQNLNCGRHNWFLYTFLNDSTTDIEFRL